MKIISVVGARPNFMKIAPFIQEINHYNQSNQEAITHLLVHTGQHYDDRMSKAFFEALNIPKADINLGIGSGTHAEQVGKTMMAFEQVLIKEQPDWVIVVGDVNATLACSVTAKKMHVKVCHIEAGLRSGDIKMPEEINRLVTDRLSDLLLTPDLISSENLRKEGVQEEKIKFVGNIMIDTLEANRNKAAQLLISDIIDENVIGNQAYINTKKLDSEGFALMTMHRPSNVDSKEGKPSARIVLLKGLDENGFIFYTNYLSRKAEDIKENPNVALVFLWLELHRQVRIEGHIEMVSKEISETYFQSRPKGSQIGAWASPQSQVIQNRNILEENVSELKKKYKETAQLPLPKFWGGYRVIPEVVEFWQGQPSRLHDRLRYSKNEHNDWGKIIEDKFERNCSSVSGEYWWAIYCSTHCRYLKYEKSDYTSYFNWCLGLCNWYLFRGFGRILVSLKK
ncbi:pyridoxamine 5'-phosphate oxidase [bacterium]|nr:pyridoxamine 5'-phosphate oxidase [bacterium]